MSKFTDIIELARSWQRTKDNDVLDRYSAKFDALTDEEVGQIKELTDAELEQVSGGAYGENAMDGGRDYNR